MAVSVADRSSNKNDQIVHAAEVIGRSRQRSDIFREIYTGKRKTKSVDDLMTTTGLPRTRVLDAGKALADNELVHQTKIDGITAYTKIEFFQRYRDRVLRLARNPEARAEVHTKRQARASAVSVDIRLKIPKMKVKAHRVTVDDIESFANVKDVAMSQPFMKVAETTFKRGVATILGERGEFKDWGGELRDLSSTRLILRGRRRATAFAFKGPGKVGKLVPGKMGKNGDQIQRLARCPAEVYIIQYWGEIDDSTIEQLEELIRAKAYLKNEELWYGIIDGQDSTRLMKAYPRAFAKKGSKRGS